MNTFSHVCISSGTHNLMYLSVHLKMYDLGSDLTQHKDMMYFHLCYVNKFSKAISVRKPSGLRRCSICDIKNELMSHALSTHLFGKNNLSLLWPTEMFSRHGKLHSSVLANFPSLLSSLNCIWLSVPVALD